MRGIEADVLPTCARHGIGVITYSPLGGGWLSGRWRKEADLPTPSPARQRLANRYDLSLPVNQRKLEAAEALAQLADDADMSLIEMAIAFVLNHPAVTSAIIGPRTQLPESSAGTDGEAPLEVADLSGARSTEVNWNSSARLGSRARLRPLDPQIAPAVG